MKWWIIGSLIALFILWNLLKPFIIPTILFGVGWFGYQFWKNNNK